MSLSRDVTAGWNADGCSGRAPCTEMTTQLVLARTFCGVCRRPSGTGVPQTGSVVDQAVCGVLDVLSLGLHLIGAEGALVDRARHLSTL